MNYLMSGLITIFCAMLLLQGQFWMVIHLTYCPDTIRLAAKHQIILFALPPNTTHISQPLDKGCFSS